MTMSRRELFSWFRHPTPAACSDEPVRDVPAPAPANTFSLDAFYAGRDADRTIPPFAIRATTSATQTTRIGVGPTVESSTSRPAGMVAPIAPGLVLTVLEDQCLATRSFCSVCVERCPVPGAIVVERGRPRVDAAHCDGCGLCVASCPAPVLAFSLVPRDPAVSR